MIVKTKGLTAEGSTQTNVESGTIVEEQIEVQIAILNVGNDPAARTDNNMLVTFDKSIDEVYMPNVGGLHGRQLGKEEYMKELKSCKGQNRCDIKWQTVDPGGQVTLGFAFLTETVEMVDLPYIAHGGREPEKWTCCGIVDRLRSSCDKVRSSSWVPNVSRVLMGKRLMCPEIGE